MTVPSKALRFTPNEALLAEGEKIEDCEGNSKLWTKEGNVFKAYRVETGTTNGVKTEIVSGISIGTEVLADFSLSGSEKEQEDSPANPFMPRPKNKNQNQNKK